MPPVLERTTVPRGNIITLEIPEEYRNYAFRVVMIPIDEEKPPKGRFSQFVGKLKWNGGDPVVYQRSMRDEW